jgi:hypothetical protein
MPMHVEHINQKTLVVSGSKARHIMESVPQFYRGGGLSFLVLGRAFYIQNVQGNYWRSMSDSMHQRFIELGAERGTIYSEDGQMLSTSVPYFDIYMDFGADGLREKKGKRFKENIDSLSTALSLFFKDKTSAQYKKDLKRAYNESNRYFLLKKGLTFEEYKTFRSFPLVRQVVIKRCDCRSAKQTPEPIWHAGQKNHWPREGQCAECWPGKNLRQPAQRHIW